MLPVNQINTREITKKNALPVCCGYTPPTLAAGHEIDPN